MTLYGSAAGVAALAPRLTDGGAFTADTRPAIDTVEEWLSQVSAMVEACYVIYEDQLPELSTGTYQLILDGFVNEEVAAMAQGVNGTGRYGPSEKRGSTKHMFGSVHLAIDEFFRNLTSHNALVSRKATQWRVTHEEPDWYHDG